MELADAKEKIKKKNGEMEQLKKSLDDKTRKMTGLEEQLKKADSAKKKLKSSWIQTKVPTVILSQ